MLSLSSTMTIFVLQNVENAQIMTENPQSLALKILSGNGFCDDATNTNSFNFDDGDCCLPKATPGTVFENRQKKSRIQHCERSELRLHFE